MAALKEVPKKEALKHFLDQYCELKPITTGSTASKDRCYVLNTKDCMLFMAEAYVQGMRTAIGQTDEVMVEAKRQGDYSNVIMVYNWSAPDPGMDVVQIPEKLVESLSKEQASVFLRNLQSIQKDVEEGKTRKLGLQELFRDTATIRTSYALDGERKFVIAGKATGHRRYAERYAEQVATNVLFDLPKALNAQLQNIVPPVARGKFFVEGRKNVNKKIRFGAETHTELVLKDKGAAIYTELAKSDARVGGLISTLFQKAMTDPFDLSLKYYMGKHPLIKLSSKKDD